MASATKALQTLCTQRYVTPAALARQLDEASSREWRDWLPEMLRDFIGLPFENVQALDKVMAVQVAVTNPDLGDEWPLFLAVNSAFNSRRANFEWMDAPSYLELAWTCTCLQALTPGLVYGPEVRDLVSMICRHDGVVYFPWGGLDLTIQSGPTATWLAEAWKNGLQDTTLTEVDEHDQRAVQAAKLVAGQEYVRACELAGRA